MPKTKHTTNLNSNPDEMNLECNKTKKLQHEWQTSGDRHQLIFSSIFRGRVLVDEGSAPLSTAEYF